MAACQQVRTWITQNVLIPVTSFLTAAREACENTRQWIEEQVSRPVERLISQQERQCRELPWWLPFRWLCEIIVVVMRVVVWVVVTVGTWVVVVVCQVVTIVIGLVVTLILRVIAWFVTFWVCLFTDPAEALKSFRDLWMIIIDAFDDISDFVEVLFNDIIGILTDVEHLIDSLATSLGWLGVPLGLLKGIIHFIRNLVDAVRDFVSGIREVVQGLLSLNTCRTLRGITDVGTSLGRVILASGLAPVAILIPGISPLAIVLVSVRIAGAAIGGVRDTINLMFLEGVITSAINNAFGVNTPRATRSIDKVGVGVYPMGLPFTIDARRLFLNSNSTNVDLRLLHNSGVIDLYALAGYVSGCKDLINGPSGEVVYGGTDMRVSYADLDAFLLGGAGSVPEFHVFPITRAKFRMHLETARRKASDIGVQAFFPVIASLEATSLDHIPLNALDESPPGAAVQLNLFRSLGRNGQNDDLSIIPAISHFHYVNSPTAGRESLFGLTSWFRQSCRDANPSGVTYRNRTPDWVFRWVLVHELGHYWGLNHEWNAGHDYCGPGTNMRSLDEIMFVPDPAALTPSGSAFLEYLFLDSEPRFTSDDAITVWKWITTDGANSLLP